MPTRHSPTLPQLRVAAFLLQTRTRLKLTARDAATAVDRDASWLTNGEKGKSRLHPNDIKALLDVYEITDPELRTALLEAASLAKTRGWWQKNGRHLAKAFDAYLGLETDATYIRMWEALVMPGLLQTRAYAEAIVGAGVTLQSVAERDSIVDLRMERQALLARDNPPTVRVVLDEAVLRRPVGTPEVMREQIAHLLEAAEQPNVQIQVLPFSAGAHPGANGPFTVLELPPPALPAMDTIPGTIAYFGLLLGGLYLSESDDTNAVVHVFEELRALALTPADSSELLSTMGKQLPG